MQNRTIQRMSLQHLVGQGSTSLRKHTHTHNRSTLLSSCATPGRSASSLRVGKHAPPVADLCCTHGGYAPITLCVSAVIVRNVYQYHEMCVRTGVIRWPQPLHIEVSVTVSVMVHSISIIVQKGKSGDGLVRFLFGKQKTVWQILEV